MKNYSLILKIALIIFMAFALILGNEIRIGVQRYVTNTLEIDASTNARSMEKLEKVYIENNEDTDKLFSKSFMDTYEHFLDDSTKIKCLTDEKGNIINISRPGFDEPAIHLVMNNNGEDEVIYFDLSTMHEAAVTSLGNYLANNHEEDIILKIEFTNYTKDQEDIAMFNKINIKALYVNDYKFYENMTLTGDVHTSEGFIGYFCNIDYEMYFEIENKIARLYFDGGENEIVKEKVVIYDYSKMRKELENQLENHFTTFLSNKDNFMNTSYSQYYLLDLIKDEEYRHLSYSTTMCKFLNWNHVTSYDQVENIELLEEQATEGYCFIIQKYNHLHFDALKVFVFDNITTYSLTVLLIGLICIMIGYIIVNPIRKIERIAISISQKDFRKKLKENRHDEIGSLSRSINYMGSELEKTIESLNKEIDHVKQLEDLRKEFVSNFTHEIKTPLGIINGFSELIQIEDNENKRNEYLDIIRKETEKINQLVLAMLDLSKLESKNTTIETTDFDIVLLTENILETMNVYIQNNKITVKKDFHPYTIHADYQKMEMIITNLISNAIRYTKEGHSIYITINEEGFYIENESSHLSEEELSKVWLAFQKGDKARTSQGTGLGLAIVKAALELHNMRYGVANTQKGVLFYFEYK